jgi:hypothetical protein
MKGEVQMKRNIWINLLMACGLLLTLANFAGAQAAASTTDVSSALNASPGTASTYPDRLNDDSGPVNGPNGLDLKQTLDNFVANAGQPVGADEIVSFLTEQAKPALQASSFGLAAVFNPAETKTHIAATKLTDSKFVVAYTDKGNSDYGTAIVGQISGTNITWGNEYVFNAETTNDESVVALTDSKFVVAYSDGRNAYSWYGTAIVGQVSGTSITWGNEYVFNMAATGYVSVAALTDSKFVVAYTDWGIPVCGAAIVGTVSGTVIGYGSETIFWEDDVTSVSVAALSDSKFVVAFRWDTSDTDLHVRVGEITGTTINYGQYMHSFGVNTDHVSVAALSEAKFVVAYTDQDNSDYGTAVVGQVSGTSVSYGSEYVFNAAATKLFHSGGVARLSETTFVVGYENLADSDGRVIVGAVSGNTIIFGNQVSYNAGSNSSDVTVMALSPSKYVVAWSDESNSGYGTAKVGTLPSLGLAAVFNPAATSQHIATAKLTDSKFVVAYSDGIASYGTVRVGQVSGTSITWGNEYVFNLAATDYVSVAALTDSKFVVAYRNGGDANHGTAKVGQVSGTSINDWGSVTVFNAAATDYVSVAALTDSQFVVAYRNGGDANHGTAIVGQVSGTSISYGSAAVFNAADTAFASVAALTDRKLVVAYTDLGNSYYGTVRVGQVSGTSIIWDEYEYVFNPATTYDGSIAILSDTDFVVAYQDGGNAGYGTAVVGQVSGTVIGYGPETVFNPASTKLFHSGGVARLSPTDFVVGFENQADSEGRVIVGTVSGNAITFGHQVLFKAGSDSSGVTVVGLSPKFVVVWADESNGYYGTAKIGMISPNGQGGDVYLPLILRN